MFHLRRLLTHGFFPMEIPQCFTAGAYGRMLTARGLSPPQEMVPDRTATRDPRPLARHNLARVGRLRRTLAVPHPVPYFALAREIIQSWSDLQPLFLRGDLSVSQPVMDLRTKRAFVAKFGPPDYARLRAHHRSNARYLLYTDVLQCYSSIYTHSIAWAVEGKARAKQQRRDLRLLGNRLDRRTMELQDGQTRGIPIGPDTSRVLSELVLTAVDEKFRDRVSGTVAGFRAVDDYELGFSSPSEAEEALANLQSALSTYELQLNEQKTRIVDLPTALEESWPHRLRHARIRSGTRHQINDLLSLFSLAFELAVDNRERSVLRYAIRICRGSNLGNQAWPAYQQLLLQCAAAEPGTLRYVTAELRTWWNNGRKLDLDRIQDLTSKLIRRHVPLGHGSEVAWAVWMSIVLKAPLGEEAVRLLPELEDPFVPLLALRAEECGLVSGTLDKTRWVPHATPQGLEGSNWLVSYEGAVRGWLPGGTQHVDDDPVFGFFKRRGISFFNSRASATRLGRWERRLTDAQLIGYGI